MGMILGYGTTSPDPLWKELEAAIYQRDPNDSFWDRIVPDPWQHPDSQVRSVWEKLTEPSHFNALDAEIARLPPRGIGIGGTALEIRIKAWLYGYQRLPLMRRLRFFRRKNYVKGLMPRVTRSPH